MKASGIPTALGRRAFIGGLAAAPAAAQTAPRPPLPERRLVPEKVGMSWGALRDLVGYFEREVESEALPGVVLYVARRGEIVLHDAVGFRDREAGAPMMIDSVFPVASMTAPVTTVAALSLVEEGALSLPDPVSRHVPELAAMTVSPGRSQPPAPASRAITVHDLMRHTSGLAFGRHAGAAGAEDRGAFLSRLAAAPLAFEPGAGWRYGPSTELLGLVVEAVAGRPLDEIVAERITTPLRLARMGFRLTPDLARVRALARVNPRTGRRPEPALAAAEGLAWIDGGAGLLSSAADYGRFARMLLAGGELDEARVLGRKTVELMTSDHVPPSARVDEDRAGWDALWPNRDVGVGFGLGVAVRVDEGRGGALGGAGTFFWGGQHGSEFLVDPREDLVAVMMAMAPAGERLRHRLAFRSMVYAALME